MLIPLQDEVKADRGRRQPAHVFEVQVIQQLAQRLRRVVGPGADAVAGEG